MIPQRLIIDGLDWQVDVKDLSITNCGETRKDDCHIVIASRLPEQVREQTFWHEWFHAAAASRDFRCPEDLDSDGHEEWVATCFGPALHSFLLANAKVTWNEHCFRQVASS